jgi:ABC-type phosphate/phosphonate transport system ATPase subunit
MRILGYRLSNDEAVTIADRDWGQHLYCIGASGAGKSTFLEGLNGAGLSRGQGASPSSTARRFRQADSRT